MLLISRDIKVLYTPSALSFFHFSDGLEVAVIYFRNFYGPQNFTSEKVYKLNSFFGDIFIMEAVFFKIP